MTKVAILGFGVVGSGVAEVITQNGASIAEKTAQALELKYILDVRDFPDSPYANKIIKDFAVIEQDPEVDVVVETIGGAKVALDFTRRALAAGKSVVSSNKELVAQHGHELLELARANGVSYLFEASVGGGIPILHPLSQCLTANKISEVRGILNGTTNYILTHMIGTGLSFEEALKEAQARGYAEHDPTADVEGLDACRKICILASIAFGRHVYPDQVPTKGITQVTLADVSYADAAGMKVKLLGRALRQGDKVMAYVAPHLVREVNPLAGVEDVFNAITVRGNAIGDVMFYGRGAGKLPTASAVVADVIDASQQRKNGRYLSWEDGGEDYVLGTETLKSQWFLRLKGTMKDLESLGNVTVLGRPGAPEDEVGVITEAMTQVELAQRLAGREPLSVIRVLDESADLA